MKLTHKFIFIAATVFSVFIYSCKKEKTDTPASTGTNNNSGSLSSSTVEYIKYTIGGVNYSITQPSNGIWAGGSDMIETDFSTGKKYYKIWSTFQGAPHFNLQLCDTTPFSTTPVSDTWFKQFFTLKNYDYSPKALTINNSNTIGIDMSTKDNSNVFWYSVCNPIPSFQNGSLYTIVDKVEYIQSGKLNIKYKATFNCKMYNSAGDSTMLTNGEMIVSFSN